MSDDWKSDLEAHKALLKEARKAKPEENLMTEGISLQELLDKTHDSYKEINNLDTENLDAFIEASFELYNLLMAMNDYINNPQISEAVNSFIRKYIGIAADAGFDFGLEE